MSDSATFSELKDLLRTRCRAAKLEHADVEVPEDGADAGLAISLPAGREQRKVYAFDVASARRLVAIPFEEYRFIGDYDAIAHYGSGALEAALRSSDLIGMQSARRQLFSGTPDDEEIKHLILSSSVDGSTWGLELGRPSKEGRALISRADRGSSFTVRINGPPIATHDQATERLEAIANAFLLQVDLKLGIALMLARFRRPSIRLGIKNRSRAETPAWRFPDYSFPREPTELYWYARSARGLPLLEFLAYYQVLEYFFSVYSQSEARTRVRNVLKDPAFDPEHEADLTRLLSAVRPVGQGAYGNERSQLKDTIRACVDAEALRRELSADEPTKDFFSKRRTFPKQAIALGNAQADILNDVAERIYEIRCTIVHTKSEGSDGDAQLLLPYSREAQQLSADISLVRFVARQVLIASGKPFR